MNRHFSAILAFIMAGMFSVAGLSRADDASAIHIPNQGTESYIRARLVENYGQAELMDESVPISIRHVAGIKTFMLVVDSGVDSLAGLQAFPDLTGLTVFMNSDTDLIIPDAEGFRKLTDLVVIGNGLIPSGRLEIKSDLPALNYLMIDYAFREIHLDAKALPSLTQLNIGDTAFWRGGQQASTIRSLHTLVVENEFASLTNLQIHDSGKVNSYQSLLDASHGVTSLSLIDLKASPDDSANPGIGHHLDFTPFENLRSLSLSSRSISRVEFSAVIDRLTSLHLRYQSGESLFDDNLPVNLRSLTLMDCHYDAVEIDSSVRLENFGLYGGSVGTLRLKAPHSLGMDGTEVSKGVIDPALEVAEDAVTVRAYGGHFVLQESEDMVTWKVIHESPDNSDNLRSYQYRRGLRRDAANLFYRIRNLAD
jgi:hypothetical protein